MYAIEIRQLTKIFPGQSRAVINDIAFAVPAGECVSLLGPSGCGKTTLLRLIMGLEPLSAGSIAIDPALRAQMSYVFQEPRLVPWRTTLENVLLPLELGGRLDRNGRGAATELLQRLGLGQWLDHFPKALSGGMQMRVALARALVTRPRILLLDEPFAALDERTRFHLQDVLLALKGQLNLQYLFVTHSISEAVYLGDRVLLLGRNGQIETDRRIDFAQRDQDLKLSAAFNEQVRDFSRLFAGLEDAA
jgi:NitT/TauT family transport system ATP-binding protein